MVRHQLPGFRPILVHGQCDCPQAVAEAEAERRKAEQEARAEKFRAAWRASGIPAAFSHVEADFSMVPVLDANRAVYLTGKTGRGKSWRAAQYVKGYLIRHTVTKRVGPGSMTFCDRQARFLAADAVQSLIRSTYGRWSQSEEDLFRQWTEVDLLLFDDVGKGVSDERNAETTFRILRTRMDNEKATVITSQYTTADLADALRGRDETLDAIRSRLRGWCEGVVLDGPDRRLERSGPAQGPQS